MKTKFLRPKFVPPVMNSIFNCDRGWYVVTEASKLKDIQYLHSDMKLRHSYLRTSKFIEVLPQ